MTQTDVSTTIKDLMDEFKEYVITINAALIDQDVKFDEKLEKHIQPLTLQAKENSEILNKKVNMISSIKVPYD